MVVVRLARGGAKKHPFYHIVVSDSRRPRDSGYIERLGYFNPFATKEETPVFLDRDRFDYWLSQGAKSSQRVSSLISKLDKGKFAVKAETKTKETKSKTEKVVTVEAESSDTNKTTKTKTEELAPASVQTQLDLQEDKQEGKQAAAAASETEKDDKATSEEVPADSPASSEAADK